MKKVICILLSTILIFALVGCDSGDDSNYIEQKSKIETVGSEEGINKEKSKTLCDFAPTYKECLQQLTDAGVMTGDTKVDFIKFQGRNAVQITYKEVYLQSYYTINLLYDLNDKVCGIAVKILKYDLTDEPISVYLKNFPNSLYGENNIIEYVKANGKNNDNEIKLVQDGIEYAYSSEYWDTLGGTVHTFTVEIAPNYEVENTESKEEQ